MHVPTGNFMPAGDTDMGRQGPSGLKYGGIRDTERQTNKQTKREDLPRF